MPVLRAVADALSSQFRWEARRRFTDLPDAPAPLWGEGAGARGDARHNSSLCDSCALRAREDVRCRPKWVERWASAVSDSTHAHI